MIASKTMVLAGSVFALTAAMAVPAMANTTEVVRIGFSAPLTGPQANAGNDNLGGMEMAILRLNAQNLVIGGKKITFEAMIEDDQGDPRSGMGAVQKLVDMPVSAMIGPYNSGVVMPTSRLLNEAGIVTLTVASNPKITQQGYKNVFRVAPSDSQLGGKMASYAADTLHLKRIAVIDDRTVYGQGLAQEFSKVAKGRGIKVVAMEYTNDKATDFNAILTSIKSKHPDAIFYGGYAPQGGPMRRQMHQLGLDVPMLGGESICSPEMGRLGGEQVNEKVFCARSGGILDKTEGGKVFAADYRAQHKRMPEVFAASYYDAMMLLAHAMQEADATSGQKLHAAMVKTSYRGVAGMYEFDKEHNLKESPVTIFKFQAGLPIPIGSY